MVDFPRPAAQDDSLQQLWGEPLVVPPASTHTHTLMLLHGFSSNPNTVLERWLPGLRARLSDGFSYDGLEGMKILLPPAPVLPISCYGEQRPRYPAWHDFLSVGQAAAGTEEAMDVSQLGETRQRLHEMLDTEIAALGDPSRVLVAGHSQGGCVACDLACTYHLTLGGCFISRGHLYEATEHELLPERADTPILQCHGTADGSIAAALALQGVSTLLKRGFANIELRLLPGTGHAESPCEAAELDSFASALRRWGAIPTDGPAASHFFQRDVKTS